MLKKTLFQQYSHYYINKLLGPILKKFLIILIISNVYIDILKTTVLHRFGNSYFYIHFHSVEGHNVCIDQYSRQSTPERYEKSYVIFRC